MPINYELMKDKINKLNKKSSKTDDIKFFKLTTKDADIRFLPAKDGDPFKETNTHYVPNTDPKIKKQKFAFTCPKRTWGEPCPICEFVSKLYEEKTDASLALAKELQAGRRFASAIIVRGQEEEGPMIVQYNKTNYEYLIKKIVDPEYGDFTDALEGTDVKMSKEKKPAYTVDVFELKRRPSKLANKDEIEAILEKMPDMESLYKRSTYEEMEAALDKYIESLDDSPSDEPPSDDAVIDRAMEELGN